MGPRRAGTVEEGETYESNIIKEAKEELGIEGFTLVKGSKRFRSGKHTRFSQSFVTQIDQPIEYFHPDPIEVASVMWISMPELKKDCKATPTIFCRVSRVGRQSLRISRGRLGHLLLLKMTCLLNSLPDGELISAQKTWCGHT